MGNLFSSNCDVSQADLDEVNSQLANAQELILSLQAEVEAAAAVKFDVSELFNALSNLADEVSDDTFYTVWTSLTSQSEWTEFSEEMQTIADHILAGNLGEYDLENAIAAYNALNNAAESIVVNSSP